MPNSVQVDGVPRLLRTLEGLAAKAREGASKRVSVGFSAPYSVFVHEDLTAYHAGGGQAKYLESPLRAMHQELAGIVAAEMKNGATLVEAERKAAERLLAVSQTLVPVDTGNLRDSGFIEVV
jgi:uncharacterized protein (DUF1501 family)